MPGKDRPDPRIMYHWRSAHREDLFFFPYGECVTTTRPGIPSYLDSYPEYDAPERFTRHDAATVYVFLLTLSAASRAHTLGGAGSPATLSSFTLLGDFPALGTSRLALYRGRQPPAWPPHSLLAFPSPFTYRRTGIPSIAHARTQPTGDDLRNGPAGDMLLAADGIEGRDRLQVLLRRIVACIRSSLRYESRSSPLDSIRELCRHFGLCPGTSPSGHAEPRGLDGRRTTARPFDSRRFWRWPCPWRCIKPGSAAPASGLRSCR